MIRRTLQRLRKSATSAAALLALSVLVPAIVLALPGWWDYAGTVAAAGQDLHDTIDILSDDVGHGLDDGAALLDVLRDQFDRPEAQTRLPPDVASRIDEFLKVYPQVVRAAVLDRHGTALYTSGATASGDAENALLRSLADSDRSFAIGAPSETGTDALTVALRRQSPDGAFNGIIFLSLSTERVKALFARTAARRQASVAWSLRTSRTSITCGPLPFFTFEPVTRTSSPLVKVISNCLRKSVGPKYASKTWVSVFTDR